MDLEKTSQSNSVKPKIFYGYIIILLSFLVMAVNGGSRTSFGVFLKPILAELESSRGLLSGVFSLSLLVNACLSIPVGQLVDKIGPRLIITFCGLFMGVGYIFMSQANTIWQMYILYGVFIGAGNALHVPIMSTVVRWFSTKRNIMLGIVGAGNSIGTMILPPFASSLISVYDWRISFAILGTIVTPILLVAAQFLKKSPDKSGFQANGADMKKDKSSQTNNKGITFKEALMIQPLWLFILLYFVFGASCFTFIVHIVPYATDLGISATNAATIISVAGAMGIVGRIILGRIGDDFGVHRSVPIGLVCRLVSMICVMFAKELWMFYVIAVIFGISWGTNVQGISWVAQAFGTRSVGAISGICNIGYTIGVAVGPFLAGYIFDRTQSYQWAFMMLVIIVLIGIITTRLLPTKELELKSPS